MGFYTRTCEASGSVTKSLHNIHHYYDFVTKKKIPNIWAWNSEIMILVAHVEGTPKATY